MKGDNLLPEQRKKTGQRGHHRSASQTKRMRIHDRAHGKKCGWTTSASIHNRHKLPRAQIGESGMYSVLWCMDLSFNCASPPCIAKLSCRKLTAPNYVRWICNSHPQTCICE